MGGRDGEQREQSHSSPFLPSPGLQPSNILEAGEHMVKNETSYFLLQAVTFHDVVAGNHGALRCRQVLVLLEQKELHVFTSMLHISWAVWSAML